MHSSMSGSSFRIRCARPFMSQPIIIYFRCCICDIHPVNVSRRCPASRLAAFRHAFTVPLAHREVPAEQFRTPPPRPLVQHAERWCQVLALIMQFPAKWLLPSLSSLNRTHHSVHAPVRQAPRIAPSRSSGLTVPNRILRIPRMLVDSVRQPATAVMS